MSSSLAKHGAIGKHGFHSSLQGASGVMRVLDQFGEDAKAEMAKAVNRNVRRVWRQANALVPVSTGKLKSQLTLLEATKEDIRAAVIVDSEDLNDTIKAFALDYGTAHMPAQGYLKAQQVVEGPKFRRSVLRAFRKIVKETQRKL